MYLDENAAFQDIDFPPIVVWRSFSGKSWCYFSDKVAVIHARRLALPF
jgi:hypothetical protein